VGRATFCSTRPCRLVLCLFGLPQLVLVAQTNGKDGISFGLGSEEHSSAGERPPCFAESWLSAWNSQRATCARAARQYPNGRTIFTDTPPKDYHFQCERIHGLRERVRFLVSRCEKDSSLPVSTIWTAEQPLPAVARTSRRAGLIPSRRQISASGTPTSTSFNTPRPAPLWRGSSLSTLSSQFIAERLPIF